jgi:soluble lytic murein transglycosylase
VKRETFIATAVGEVRSQAADAGWHPDVLHQAERETVSNIYARAAQAKLDRGDVEGAHSLIEGSRDKILPEAQATLDAALKGPLEDRQVDGIVDTIYGTSTPLPDVTSSANIAGNVLPRMVSITTHSESGGRDFGPNGQILTSPKGAQGSMQVMPTTQTDPGYGVRPAKDNSVAEKARVGREYLAALYQHYGRDPAKAWAAYNWGPGNFDNAVEQFGSDVMNHLPRETAAYVAANMAALGGRGVNPVPQQRPQKVDLNTLLGRVDALNLPFDLEHKVKQEVRSRAVLDEGLLDKQRADAQDQAWEVVNNLGKGFTSINQIPVAIRARMSPSAIHSFMSLGETNQHRESTTNWASYAQYSDLYAKNPTAFAALNPAELRTNLSDGDFKEVMGWRQHALEVAQGKPSKDQVTYSRVQGIIDPMMEAAGIFKPPAKRGSGPQRPSDLAPTVAWQQRRGKLMQSVMGDVDIWHQLNPTKQIDDQTIHDIADRQMMRVWQQGRPETAQMAFERPEEAKRGRWTFALPNVDRDRIVDQYRRRWGRDPTSDEVADIYRLGPRGGK